MYGASDISSVQAEGVSSHNRKTVVPSWVRRDNSCFLYRGLWEESGCFLIRFGRPLRGRETILLRRVTPDGAYDLTPPRPERM